MKPTNKTIIHPCPINHLVTRRELKTSLEKEGNTVDLSPSPIKNPIRVHAINVQGCI